MKKLLLVLFVIFSIVLCSCSKNIDNMDFESVELNSIFEEIKNNSARAEELYVGKTFEFGGVITSISTDSFILKSLQDEVANCTIKSKNVEQDILKFNDNDYIKIFGEITSTYYNSINVDVYKVEKPEVFSYDGFYFGMDINDVRNKETRDSLTNGSVSGNEIPYIIDDFYIDEFGYNPDFIRYGFHSWKLSKISLSYSDVDLSFFNTVVNKLTTQYGDAANTKEDTNYIKRFITDSVLITVYYYEDSNSAGIVFMYPAYYSLSNYLTK